ncbi:MAG: hypothetical protein KDB90_17860 [Planctomycetes bacterium]|nr:hypothetical protein [Planctomycetota bacterium]
MLSPPELYPEHIEILDHPARFKVLVKGRRWGGTVLGDVWIADGDIMPGEVRMHISPYLKQAKKNVMPFLEYLARSIKGARFNRSDLQLEFPNRAIIRLCGADNPDSIPGEGCARAWLDEYDLFKDQGVWDRIIRPMLTDTLGEALFTSSPRGRRKMYDFYLRGMSGDPEDADWKSWLYTTAQSRFIDPEEVVSAKRDMDPVIYAQEYEASFETGGDRCAWNFSHDKHVTDHGGVIPPVDQCWIGQDFNVAPMLAELAGYINVNGRRVLHFFDEIVIRENANTDKMATALQERFPGIRTTYPDPTGSARGTQGTKSDHDIMHERGFAVRAHAGSPSHKARLAAWNRMLLDGDGNVNMTISPKCRRLIEDCDKAERNPDGTIDKRKRDPHALDAASYGVEYLHPILYRGVTRRRSA